MIAAIVLHVAAGGVGILSGAVAMAVRKGGRLHRRSGTVFSAAMLAMAVMATLLACVLPDWANLPGGVFSFYLVASGWASVRRSDARARLINGGIFGLGCVATVVALVLVAAAQASPDGEIGGKAMPLFAIFAGLSVFAVALDVRVLRRSGLARAQRLRRHVWRMSTALFFGTGSFFLGQQQVMPGWLQGSPVLFVLALAPLPVMVGWMFLVGGVARRGAVLGQG